LNFRAIIAESKIAGSRLPPPAISVIPVQPGDVVQLVRTLLSHRHNDVSDLEISNLVQPTSVRPVTVSAISPHFRKLVVRFVEVPDVFSSGIEVRHVWRTVFRQELIAELFDEES
jgi:hypothetical protein